jgi:hypothetical protein
MQKISGRNTGGAIVSVSLGIIFHSLTVADVVAGGVDWRWFTFGAIGFGIIFTINLVRDLTKEIKSLQDARPQIRANCETDIIDNVYIRVRNEGEAASFSARIEVLNSTDYRLSQWSQYTACWEDEPKETISIMKGHSRRLLLGKVERGYKIMTANLKIFRYGENASHKHWEYTTHSCTIPPQGHCSA